MTAPQSSSNPSLPTEMAIHAALSRVFPDPRLLAQAVDSISRSGLAATTAATAIEGVDLDIDRAGRCGFPEVVFGEGKPIEMIAQILSAQKRAAQDSLVTRLQPDQLKRLIELYPEAQPNPVARTLRLHWEQNRKAERRGPVFVVTAGSSDRPVAEEALETLRWMQIDCDLLQDAGVAGPHRLQKHVLRLQTATAIVCVAGMEAALPSVVGGYVACPVIAVPTSTGYGFSMNGLTAMLSMLTCCASNVVAVNIDAGFKGGYVAGLIASRTNFAGQ